MREAPVSYTHLKSEQREIAKKGRKIKWKIKKKEKIYKRKPRRINVNGFKRYKTKTVSYTHLIVKKISL